jgi:hypothetical protein
MAVFDYLKRNNINTLRVLLSRVDSKSRKSLSLIFKFLAKGLSKNRNLLGNAVYPLDIQYIITIYQNMYADQKSMRKLFPEVYTDQHNYLNFLV